MTVMHHRIILIADGALRVQFGC